MRNPLALRGSPNLHSVVRGHPDELLALTPGFRTFTHPRWPGFADCAPSGRVRLDALARWLQDVAYADVQDAGLVQAAVWVVRRTRMRVNRFPRFGEHFQVTTFCSGIGRMWAERRTDVVAAGADGSGPHAPDGAGSHPAAGAGRPAVEAVSVWVHLDPDRRRPSPLTGPEMEVYGGAAADRQVSARLRHSLPDSLDGGDPWRFRAVDCDIADHVNNAAYWQPLEEELLAAGAEPDGIDAEIEYRSPAQPGVKRVVHDGRYRWIVGDGDEVHASVRLGVGDAD